MGKSRLPDPACSSALASLKISTHRVRRASSLTISARDWPPRPTTPGKMIWAQTPISSMSSIRATGS